MAVDLEKLVVQLSADIKSYENAMKRASGITTAEVKKIEQAATGVGTATQQAFASGANNVIRFRKRFDDANVSIGRMRENTGNLVSQFNDIGAQLAGGASPFLIAIQQGTQINQVLGQRGAVGAVQALGAAFSSLLNPINFVTIGLIAAGGAVVQYFASLLTEGRGGADTLEEQSRLLQGIAKDWGDLLPSVQAYAGALESAAAIADLTSAKTDVLANIWKASQQLVESLVRDVAALVFQLQSIGDLDSVSALQNAFDELDQKIQDQNATGEDAQRVLDVLNSVMATGGPIAESLAGAMSGLAVNLSQVADQAFKAKTEFERMLESAGAAQEMRDSTREVLKNQEDFVAEQKRLNSLTEDQLNLEKETSNVISDAAREEVFLGKEKGKQLALDRIAANEQRAAARAAGRASGRKSGGGRAGGASEAEREREAVRKLIEELEFEFSILHLNNLEREKAIQLRKAGAAATPEQQAHIEQLVELTYAHTEAIKTNEEALKQLKAVSKDVLGGMFEDLRDGASAAEVLANALNRVGEALVTAGINTLLEGAFKNSKPGGLLSTFASLFHQGGVAGGPAPQRLVPATAFAGARRYHSGGYAGFGPNEVPVIAKRGEPIGYPSQSTSISIDVSGARGNQEIMQMVQAGVQRGLEQQNRILPDRVSRIISDPRYRG